MFNLKKSQTSCCNAYKFPPITFFFVTGPSVEVQKCYEVGSTRGKKMWRPLDLSNIPPCYNQLQPQQFLDISFIKQIFCMGHISMIYSLSELTSLVERIVSKLSDHNYNHSMSKLKKKEIICQHNLPKDLTSLDVRSFQIFIFFLKHAHSI